MIGFVDEDVILSKYGFSVSLLCFRYFSSLALCAAEHFLVNFTKAFIHITRRYLITVNEFVV